MAPPTELSTPVLYEIVESGLDREEGSPRAVEPRRFRLAHSALAVVLLFCGCLYAAACFARWRGRPVVGATAGNFFLHEYGGEWAPQVELPPPPSLLVPSPALPAGTPEPASETPSLSVDDWLAKPAHSSVSAAAAAPTAAPKRTAAAPRSGRSCWSVSGVKLAETAPEQVWRTCAAKWTEDCSTAGCCQDPDMKCYNKNDGWSACKATCKELDELNETWTCKAVELEEPHTDEACKRRCEQRSDCAMAIYDSTGGGTCSLSTEPHHGVVWAADNFKSFICSDDGREEEAKEVVGKVRKQLPFTNPPFAIQECSWAGEDCSSTKCCNDVACDTDFKNCTAYSCYRKDPYFASCRIDAPPSNWDGVWLGGGRTRREVPQAGSQVAQQGSSLYCFSVVNWHAPAPKPFWNTEAELADNIKSNGVGIMQCDKHDWYDGVITPKAKWGSFSNIDAFRKIWSEVKKRGDYKNYDWVVKVDADAVFFPDRLKRHIESLKVPKGARVYLENIDYRFRFMGAIEILTREAMDTYLDLSDTCIRGKHEGGEDFFMRGCMDAIGIDHMSDFKILRDRYASMDSPCTDGWTVAYHFHKKVITWNWCYNEAVCGTRAASCEKGLDVEYVAPWTPAPSTSTTLLPLL